MEPLPDAAFDDVFEVDDAQDFGAVGHHQRGASLFRHPVDGVADFLGERSPLARHIRLDRIGGALSDLTPFQVDAAHARLGGEGDEGGT